MWWRRSKELLGWPHCGDVGRTHALLDSTNSLAAVAWGENGPVEGSYVVAGTEEEVHPVDVLGSRTNIEALSILGGNCGVPIKARVFEFVKDDKIAPRTFKEVRLPGGKHTGFVAGAPVRGRP